MTLQQLRSFTTVAQLENMSRAAELLHTSQSSLSKNISKLEAEIGVPLFSRSGKKVELNAAGSAFLDCCNQVLRSMDSTVESLRLAATGTDSRIRIGSAGIYAPLVRCMAEFSRSHPGTEFDLSSAVETEEHIDINEYDVLIYPAGVKYEKFTGYHLCRERYFLAVAAADPMAELGSVSPRRLSGRDLVFLRTGRDGLETPYELCTALALQFGSQCFADSRELHRQIVSSGIAAGFVPEGEAEPYRSDPAVRLLPITDNRFSRELMICFRRDKHLSDRAREFKEFAILSLGLKP